MSTTLRLIAVGAAVGALLLTRGCAADGSSEAARGDAGRDGEVDVAGLGFFAGDPGAPLQIVEFTDPACPFCAQFHREARADLFAEYVETGQARWITIPWESDQYPNSLPAVIAVECAPDPTTAELVTEALYDARDEWVGTPRAESRHAVRRAAAAGGVDGTSLDRCANDDQLLSRIARADSLARSLGVRGTPTYLVDGFPMMGAVPFTFVRRAFDQRLEELAADTLP